MSAKIRMNPETMCERAKQYNSEAERIGAVIKAMDEYIRQLKEEWEGAASVVFENRYLALKPGFEEAEKMVTEISEALNQNASLFENTDAQLARQFNF